VVAGGKTGSILIPHEHELQMLKGGDSTLVRNEEGRMKKKKNKGVRGKKKLSEKNTRSFLEPIGEERPNFFPGVGGGKVEGPTEKGQAA